MRARKLISTVVAALATLLVVAAPAGAATGYVNECPQLKTAFCGAFGFPRDLAVDNSSQSSKGDIWVVSASQTGAQLLQKFDPSGNLLAEISSANLPPSAQPIFASNRHLEAVAVDPTDGDVYVSASGGIGTITKFTSSGVFQFQITGSETPQGKLAPTRVLAVAPSTGDLYAGDEVGEVGAFHAIAVDKFDASGNFLEQHEFKELTSLEEAPRGIEAIDLRGDVLLEIGQFGIHENNSGSDELGYTPRLAEYSSSWEAVECPGGGSIPRAGSFGDELSAALVLANEHMFVAEASPSGPYIAEYGTPCAVLPTLRFGAGELGGASIREVPEFSVEEATSNVDAINSLTKQGMLWRRVIVPDVVTGTSPTDITRSSAVLGGVVNPDGTSVTTCEFEYGTGAVYENKAPCTQALPLTGEQPVAVSAEITGLAVPPGTSIHYRLRAASNGPGVGEDEVFFTEPYRPPVIGRVPASQIGQFGAMLHATIGTDGVIVAYHFEYGTTTAYGSIAPIPDNLTPATSETVPVSQVVGGLQAGTTYHYRLVASSPGGTEVAGPDETFTTAPVPPPVVGTGGASSVTRTQALLSGTVDPEGWDTGYRFEYGTSTAYGSSWPSVDVELGAFSGAQPVSVTVPNLQPGTTYHYRLVATNGGGAGYGPDMTFTTAQYPVSVVAETPLLSAPLGFFFPENGTQGGSVAKGHHAKGNRAKQRRRHHRGATKRGKRKRGGR